VALALAWLRGARDGGSVANVSDLCWAFAGDVITELAAGQSLRLLDDPAAGAEWRKAWTGSLAEGAFNKQFPRLVRWMRRLPVALAGKLDPEIPKRAGMFRAIVGLMNQRIAQIKPETSADPSDAKPASAELRTIVDDLLHGDLPEPEKRSGRVLQEGLNLVAAGSVTTAVTATASFYYLASDPELLRRLQAELSPVFGNLSQDEFPTVSELEQLPLLTAVLKETLRLSYGVVQRLPVIHRDEDLVFEGYKIARGTPVSLSTFDMHRDAVFGPDAEAFRPDRWISGDTTKMDKLFVAFGRGSHACLGQNLAWAEMYTFIAAVFSPSQALQYSLYETDDSDVAVAHDFFVAMPRMDSKGVRVLVE